ATPLREEDLVKKRELVERLFKAVPTGVGGKSTLRLSGHELDRMLLEGSSWAVGAGFGIDEDVRMCEQQGCMKEAETAAVSQKARQRGMPQSGTLGSGNHFLEIQVVKEVYQPEVARAFGISAGQVCIMIHCGSR